MHAVVRAAVKPRLRSKLALHSQRWSSSQSTASSSTSPFTPIRRVASASIAIVSSTLFLVYYFDSQSAVHRYVLTPLLRNTLDAETAHKVAVKALGSGLAPRETRRDDKSLETELWGMKLSSPIGVAAGFDKNGEAIDGLFNLGFSWVEIGSITPKPQPGNPRPRVFHLPSAEAMINRYGFPSEGAAAVLARLKARIPPTYDVPPLSTTTTPLEDQRASLRSNGLLAINLGKNKSSPPESISDFVNGVKTFGPYADVLVVNVSSPNTPGLRGLQTRGMLEELLTGIGSARDALSEPAAFIPSSSTSNPAKSHKPKIVLKIAPDLSDSQLRDIAEAVRSAGEGVVDGVIVSNTTIQRPKGLTDSHASEQGGLSGPPLLPLSLHALRTLRSLLPQSIPLIGCGGISSGADALEFARAGASAVQLYTSFGYGGVGVPGRIKQEIVRLLAQEGKTWMQVVDESASRLTLKENPKKGENIVRGKLAFEEGGVKELVRQAEDISKKLDELGKKYLGEMLNTPLNDTPIDTRAATDKS